MIDIVSATRGSEESFWRDSPLGLSIKRLAYDDRLRPRIVYENRRGLPEVYNAAIEAPDAAETLVFVHDDVWLDDIYFGEHLLAGLRHYDIVGVAGTRRRRFYQPCWHKVVENEQMVWEEKNYLSGAIAHGDAPCGPISYFGPAPASCELLDGVLLAAQRQSLLERELRFDARFDFHFYDMDFCRVARDKGATLGTWPVSIRHRSEGSFFSDAWKAQMLKYFAKWRS
jgi:GT2 family glycosyltransferase